MRDALHHEVERLRALCQRFNAPLTFLPGATEAEIASAEAATGIRFDEDLRALYGFTNGGADDETWFLTGSDEQGFRLCQLSEICEVHGWTTGSSFDAAWNNGGKPWDPRHQRFDRHRRWLPFADFGNGNSVLYFDDDPTPLGSHGQILRYQHDPDEIWWIASDVTDLLRRSNDLLENDGGKVLTAF